MAWALVGFLYVLGGLLYLVYVTNDGLTPITFLVKVLVAVWPFAVLLAALQTTYEMAVDWLEEIDRGY